MNIRFGKINLSFLIAVWAVLLISAPMGAFADQDITNTNHFGEDITKITISGDVKSYAVTKSTFTYGNYSDNEIYTYNIVLSGSTSSSASVTATITKDTNAPASCVVGPVPPGYQPAIIWNNQSSDVNVTLSDGVGTSTLYVHHDIGSAYGDVDKYIFNYTTADRVNPVTNTTTGLTLRFGDPDYPNTAPECYMEFNSTTGGYNAVYNNDSSSYYPDIVALYITDSDGTSPSITAMSSNNVSNVAFREYASDSYSDNTSPSNLTAGFYTIAINSADYITITTSTGSINLHFSTPNSPTASGGTTPSGIAGYLPIGQFSTGYGWGTATGKFTTGYSSTGVSLGAFGGYIEFTFENAITDNPNNPYGVDFIIYGNAFSGNAEAGAVQVSEDGKIWYELAGSLFYDTYNFAYDEDAPVNDKFSSVYTGTSRDRNVLYTLNSSNITVKLGDYASDIFTASTAYWPEHSGTDTSRIYYPEFGEYDDTGANITVDFDYNATTQTLEFGGITAVEDFNTNLSYAFGYVDVTPNGSSYGTAVNPYETFTSSKTGGDGFDLKWAVDISSGLPVDISTMSIKHIRVYTAVLDNGTFGETSTEVCGIFVTNNPETSSVGTTAAPSVTIEDETTTYYSGTPTHNADQSVDVNNGAIITVTVNTTSGNYTYINGEAFTGGSNTFTLPSSMGSEPQVIRVVVQDGTTSEAFITYFKLY